ncbi:MAG: hypothetical protein M3Y13_08185, partial [Armatimonadota bacterium]|nr:hypothetical protein [Armatimonadota bacterium]
ERKRPDQSPLESIASGKATCSGLSILLVDACRSVGIPARVVGTPMWTNLRGNHTWVEVWDGQAWRFTGAAEPDPQGLDRGWFAHDASLARKDEPQFAIYASSFQKTGLAFPLVWAPDIAWVHAVNVTDRYAQNSVTAPTDKVRLLVNVRDSNGKRIAANVTVQEIGSHVAPQEGRSKGETADTNDLLAFTMPQGGQGEVVVTQGGRTVRQAFMAGTEASQMVEIVLGAAPFSARTKERLKQALAAYFAAPADQQAVWSFPAHLEQLLRENEPAVRQAAWDAYRAAPIHAAAKSDFDAHQVQFEKYLSPYTVKTVGMRPAKGWPLFIAMHGGGGAPKELNDSQWVIMQRYYKDHPELGGYRYVALRAPNDTWYGFYDVYVYPLVTNLIKQFLALDDIDPNKVFLMGYSHGGYGAFAIGPKMPDLFAAIHASAAAPTEGETTAKTLRNTVFSCMVGDQDTMYGRLDRCRQFDADVRKLRGDRTDIYPVTVDVKVGYQHSNLPDRDEIVEMYSAVRNPVPRELTWLMTDDVVRNFFWLHTDAPGKTREIDATCRDNKIVVTTTNASSATALLDSRLVDFGKPIMLDINGQKSQRRVSPSLRTLCETLQQRGDPDLAFTAQINLPL